jgi:hypothetical protein
MIIDLTKPAPGTEEKGDPAEKRTGQKGGANDQGISSF